MKTLDTPGRIMLVSPHLDDGVFSCGDLLDRYAGATVVTVCAGTPDTGAATDWDRRCGFDNPAGAMRARRLEDRQAMDHLQATPHWLDFIDSQYHPASQTSLLIQTMHALLMAERPDTLLMPMGLFHSDHVVVSDAMFALAPEHPETRWVIYEDALYRCIAGQLQGRLAALAERGIRLTPLWLPIAPSERKATAVRCYASQLRAFGHGGWTDLAHPERYWYLDRPDTRPRTGDPT